jgi:hypothetical protein
MYEFFRDLDRRWIFLLMFLAVAIPILVQIRFPERPTRLVKKTFRAVDDLPDGSKVLLSWDWDPASAGELEPMATAFARHCCEKKHKMVFMALWPVGPQMVDDTIENVIKADFPNMVYGEDYVNLGFKPGNEGVIKVIVTDLRQLYTTDARGTNIDKIPIMRGIKTVRDFKLIINVSAGYPGVKEWVQYAATPYPDEVNLITGTTGVNAPQLYPYIPEQLHGMLGAIKGAAEYEKLVLDKYGRQKEGKSEAKYQEGLRRMGPQLVAHILMILLIIAGNVIYFVGKRREKRR